MSKIKSRRAKNSEDKWDSSMLRGLGRTRESRSRDTDKIKMSEREKVPIM